MQERLFALDHNFPQPIVASLNEYLIEADLVPLQLVDPRLPDVEDDWKVLLALHHHARPWDGLITTDSGILSQPRELSVLMQTKLTLVVAMAAGHDPLLATGLLFAHLPNISARTRRDEAQLWKLRTIKPPAENPWDELSKVAEHQNRPVGDLFHEGQLTQVELATDPLADLPLQ